MTCTAAELKCSDKGEHAFAAVSCTDVGGADVMSCRVIPGVAHVFEYTAEPAGLPAERGDVLHDDEMGPQVTTSAFLIPARRPATEMSWQGSPAVSTSTGSTLVQSMRGEVAEVGHVGHPDG